MTETKKTSRKSNANTVSKGAASRDAYDDFLDMTFEPTPRKRSTASGGKHAAAAQTPARPKHAAPAETAEKPKKAEGTARSRKTGEATPKKAAGATAGAKKSAAGSAPRAKKSADASAAPKKATKPRKKPMTHQEAAAAAWADPWDEIKESPMASSRGRHTAQAQHSAVTAPAKPRSATKKKPASVKPKAAAGRRKKDAYDAFMEAGETARPAAKKRTVSVSTVLLLACIVCMLGLFVWQHSQYQTFVVMKNAVEHEGFYDGTTVEGVDVSGMTLEQAIQHWETSVEPGYSQRAVTLSNGVQFTAAELGYSSDYVTVLNNAFNAGRRGSLEERYQALSARREQPVSYDVTRHPYSESVVQQCVSAIAEQIDRPATSAKIASFNTTTYTFEFTGEEKGSRLDAEQLSADLKSALNAGGGSVELIVQAVEPDVSMTDISSEYGMITSAITNASSSSKNRLSNIRRALELINGTCLKPGETFSFNGVVGQRTTDRGFKTATAYSGGAVVEDVGGGICQVSTTLFNAAVKADLDIVERHNHSLTVAYVDKGKDAAVNWGSQDLRFTNNSSDNVYICCYLTDDKRVRVGIFGRLLPNGETITVEGKTTGRVSYQTIYEANPSMATGETKVVQGGKVGYNAVAYKIRWDANGNEISNELLCKSSYRATNEIIQYGP